MPSPTPPVPPRRPHVREHHGHTFEDPFAWMRDLEDPALIAHLEAENAHAQARTEHLADLLPVYFFNNTTDGAAQAMSAIPPENIHTLSDADQETLATTMRPMWDAWVQKANAKGLPGQEIVDVADAPEREAGEIIEDEGEAHLKIVEFLDKLKVI